MELYKKHRPSTLDEMIGNELTISAIKEMKKTKNVPHAILLTGPSGCGKTTLARIIANDILNSNGMDYTEMDSGIYRSIDSVRGIRKSMNYPPGKGKARVWTLDEIHMLGSGGSSEKNAAQNALLKALEDPPVHAYLILCTTNPEMLLKTIRSRCIHFEMEPLSVIDTVGLLNGVIKKEKKLKSFPSKAVKHIAKCSDGHPRKALTLLEKVINIKSAKSILEVIKKEKDQDLAEIDLARVLWEGKSWSDVKKILNKVKSREPEKIRRTIISYMQAILLGNSNDSEGAWYIMSWFYEKPTYDTGFSGIVFCCFAIANGMEGPY